MYAADVSGNKWEQSYVYGAGGERISMNYLPSADGSNAWEPVAGSSGAAPNTTPETLFYLNDMLGSPLALVNQNSEVALRYHYDEFGIAEQPEKFDLNYPGPDNLFGYTGLGYDASSGLSYARARYFDSGIGRFVSEDTYPGELNNPQSLNLYTYVQNNPTGYVDPSGNYCVSPDGRNAHYGMCNIESNITNYYIPDFMIGAGFPEIIDSKVLGYYDYDKNDDLYFVSSSKVRYSTFWKEANLSEEAYYYDWVLAIPLADAVFGSIASVRFPSTFKTNTTKTIPKQKTPKQTTIKQTTTKGKVNLKYDDRVLKRMKEDAGTHHNFPTSFDKMILSNKPSVVRSDGRVEYLHTGTINGQQGVYHITLKNGVVTHRSFIPLSDWKRYSTRWELPSQVNP